MADIVDLKSAFRSLTAKEKAKSRRKGDGAADDLREFGCLPAPDDAPAPPWDHRELGEPSKRWPYNNGKGELLGYVLRFDLSDGSKTHRPLFWGRAKGRVGWHWKAPPAPRPLYNLSKLMDRPGSTVLIVEGEKAADAGDDLLPDLAVVSPMSGAKSPAYADWSPVTGRGVVIWPDHDHAGEDYAIAVAELAFEAGAASVATVRLPAELPPKWDLADPLPDGWSHDRHGRALELERSMP